MELLEYNLWKALILASWCLYIYIFSFEKPIKMLISRWTMFGLFTFIENKICIQQRWFFSFNSLFTLKSEILNTFFSLPYQVYFDLYQKTKTFFYHLIFELTKLNMLIVMHADFKIAFKNSKITLMKRLLLFHFEKGGINARRGKRHFV